mmetsp:Transcript_21631/g.43719  ORF Transcript_21631/g.43719 Transcript_21631/m.43719 type:complete len:236 (-) Transcript_21631:149-856(-)
MPEGRVQLREGGRGAMRQAVRGRASPRGSHTHGAPAVRRARRRGPLRVPRDGRDARGAPGRRVPVPGPPSLRGSLSASEMPGHWTVRGHGGDHGRLPRRGVRQDGASVGPASGGRRRPGCRGPGEKRKSQGPSPAGADAEEEGLRFQLCGAEDFGQGQRRKDGEGEGGRVHRLPFGQRQGRYRRLISRCGDQAHRAEAEAGDGNPRGGGGRDTVAGSGGRSGGKQGAEVTTRINL